MLSKRLINTIKCLKRAMSTNNFINLSVDQEGIATLSFNKPPVNSLDLEVIQELVCKLEEVEKNKHKAVILTSALPTIFSAGLDLYEFQKRDRQRLTAHWTALQDSFLKLYASSYITAVAINGYAGAGACVISMMCDYRVMVNDPKARIGLNDTTVGIVPRDWIRELMIRTIGWREAEIAITASKMYDVDEAYKVNLIDEIACNYKDAIEKCKQYIRSYDNIPAKARIEAKKGLREEFTERFRKNKKDDLEAFLENMFDPDVQRHIDMYIDALKQRKKLNR